MFLTSLNKSCSSSVRSLYCMNKKGYKFCLTRNPNVGSAYTSYSTYSLSNAEYRRKRKPLNNICYNTGQRIDALSTTKIQNVCSFRSIFTTHGLSDAENKTPRLKQQLEWSYASGGSRVPLLGLTVGQTIARAAELFPENEAVVSLHQDTRRTFAQLHRDVSPDCNFWAWVFEMLSAY